MHPEPPRIRVSRLGSLGGPSILRGSWLVVPLLASLSACVLWAPKAEYADYRRVRLATSNVDAALARARYLRRHPRGQWAEEVRERHHAAEESLFLAGRDTPPMLEAYLSAYPKGRFVSQARDRLAALRTLERQRAEERARIEARRQRMLRARRQWGRRAIGFWVKTLLRLKGWGSALPEVVEANPEFDRAFGRTPRPRCVANECVKFYRLEFSVPVPGGTRLSRRLDLLLRLRVRAGRLVGADMLLPGRGFSRWFELERREPVDDLDEQRRAEVLTWALSVLEPIAKASWPDARAVDWVPEPVPAPRVPWPSTAGQEASTLPDEPPQEGEAAARGSVPFPPQVEEGAEPADSLTLPVALGAWRRGALTLVFFAAPPDEAGAVGYDGVSILWQNDSEATEAPLTSPRRQAEPSSP